MSESSSVGSDLKDRRRQDALAAVLPVGSGRRLLVFTMTGCTPCKDLLFALKSVLEDHSAIEISNLERGDVLTRTQHIRLGARTYPTTLLIDGEEIVGTIGGYVQTGDAIETDRYVAFLSGSWGSGHGARADDGGV